MKKVLLGLTVSLSLTVAHGQTAIYHPFPEDTAIWIEDDYSNFCQGYCGSGSYEMKGDTLINSISYNKIYTRSINFYYISPPIPPNPGVVGAGMTACSYTGAIRQDSINKKVYFIDGTMITDTLLYDFNLTIGDTINGWYNKTYTPFPLVVSGIDSISINGNYHKRFNFSNYPSSTNFSLIEGMGWSSSLFGFFVSGDGAINIACFNGNIVGQVAFNNECTVPVDCSILTAINEQNEIFGLTVSPNPFCTQTVLQTVNPLHNATLTVDNCFGQTVAQIKNISGQTVVFNRDNLPSGLYFVRLTEENKTIAVDKLVIADK